MCVLLPAQTNEQNEMQKMGNLVELSEFKSLYATSQEEQGIGGWFIKNVLIKPASWIFSPSSSLSSSSSSSSTDTNYAHNSFEHIQQTALLASGGGTGGSTLGIDDDKSFVVMKQLVSLVDGLVNKVYRNRVNYCDLLLCPSELKEQYFSDRFKLSTSNIHLVLSYITREGPGTIIELSDERKGLRLYDSPADRTSDTKIANDNKRYADCYRGIIQLKETLYTMEKQQQRLRDNIHELMNESVDLIRRGQKNQAKFVLTRKKLLEKVAEKREKYLLNLHQLMSHIEQSNTDQEVLLALREGSMSLNVMNENLNNLDVEATMDDVAQSLTDFSDVQRVMSMGMEQIRAVSELEFDEDDLINELNSLSLEVRTPPTQQSKQESPTTTTTATTPTATANTNATTSPSSPTPVAVAVSDTPKSEPSPHQKQLQSPVEQASSSQSPQSPQQEQQTITETKNTTAPTATPETTTILFPLAGDVPVESTKVIEYELDELKKETEALTGDKLKLKQHLDLSQKLIRLKLKKYQKTNTMHSHIGVLQTRIEECEERATEMQTEGRSDDGLRIMTWISLMEEEIEELEKSSSSSSIATPSATSATKQQQQQTEQQEEEEEEATSKSKQKKRTPVAC